MKRRAQILFEYSEIPTLKVGTRVTIIDDSEKEWVLISDDQKQVYFPKSYIGEFPQTPQAYEKFEREVVVLYAVPRPHPGSELGVEPGDHCELIEKTNKDWWSLRTVTGINGYFPANYVKEVVKSHPPYRSPFMMSREANQQAQASASQSQSKPSPPSQPSQQTHSSTTPQTQSTPQTQTQSQSQQVRPTPPSQQPQSQTQSQSQQVRSTPPSQLQSKLSHFNQLSQPQLRPTPQVQRTQQPSQGQSRPQMIPSLVTPPTPQSSSNAHARHIPNNAYQDIPRPGRGGFGVSSNSNPVSVDSSPRQQSSEQSSAIRKPPSMRPPQSANSIASQKLENKQLEDTNTQIKNLETQLEKSSQEIRMLNQQLDSANSTISQIKQESVQIKQESTQTKQECEKIKQESAQIKQESTQIKQESAQIKQESTQIKQESAQIKQESTQTKQESEKIKQESAQIKQESTQIKQESTQIKQESTQIKQESTQIKQESTQIKQELAQIKQESVQIKQESTRIKQESVQIKQESAQLKQELAQLKLESSKSKQDPVIIKQLKQESTQIKQESEQIKQESALIKQESNQLKQELARVRQELSQISVRKQDDAVQLSQDVANLRNEIAQLKLTIASKDATIAQAQNDLLNSRKEIEKLKEGLLAQKSVPAPQHIAEPIKNEAAIYPSNPAPVSSTIPMITPQVPTAEIIQNNVEVSSQQVQTEVANVAPDKLFVVADTYEVDPSETSQIALDVNTLVELLDASDEDWAYVRTLDDEKLGYYPKACLRHYAENKLSQQTPAESQAFTLAGINIPPGLEVSKLKRATLNYVGEDESQLTLNKGDVAFLLDDSNPDWDYVKDMRTKQDGYFPKELLEQISPDEIQNHQSQGSLGGFAALTTQSQSGSLLKPGSMMTVIGDYTGEDETQLTLSVGDRVVLIETTNEDWTYIQIPETSQEGYFPTEFLKS